VRKVTLSAGATDRLSKPTAASLSKAKTPVNSPSPARGGAKKTVASSKATTKQKVGMVGAKANAENAAVNTEDTSAVVGAVAAATVAQDEDAVAEEVLSSGSVHETSILAEGAGEAELVDDEGEPEVIEQHAPVDDDDEPEVMGQQTLVGDDDEPEVIGQHALVDEPKGQDLVDEPEEQVEVSREDSGGSNVKVEIEERITHTELKESTSHASPEPESFTELDATKATVGNDIEDIVNLLEAPAQSITQSIKAHPAGSASIPDELVAEIPDED
jgi:hypothetical protein